MNQWLIKTVGKVEGSRKRRMSLLQQIYLWTTYLIPRIYGCYPKNQGSSSIIIGCRKPKKRLRRNCIVYLRDTKKYVMGYSNMNIRPASKF
jgi:hypothetical protein